MPKQVELHITDIMQFKQCRLRWLWQSPLRYNLQPAGQPPALFLGQGVHYALDAYYSAPVPRRVEVAHEAFRSWARERADAIEGYTGKLWQSQRDMINDMYRLGYYMLLHYHLWAQGLDDDLNVMGTEYKFKVDVPTPDHDPLFEGPEALYHLTLAGRFDGVIQRRSTGEMLLLEFKTASSFRFAPYTMRSLQTGSYQWAANVIPDFAKYGPIVGMLYRFMWKRIPDDPKWLEKSGRYSRNMSIKSTAEWVRYAIEYAGHDPKEYRDFILALDERGNDFFMQRVIHRTPQQIDDITRAIYEFGKMMCDPDVPIFEQGGFHCSYCPFADPCALREKGMDYEGLLAAEYNTRDYWEESEE